MSRASDDVCGNCIFSRSPIDAEGKVDFAGQRQCKWEPPKVFPIPSPQGIQFVNVRPGVATNEWCGKHERRE
jgi:hypothetical protein